MLNMIAPRSARRLDVLFFFPFVFFVVKVNILVQRARLWVTPGRGCVTVERVKSARSIPTGINSNIEIRNKS